MEIKKSKLYTKTGDKGMTRLVDGQCVEKFNLRVEAYGCIDELNSYLGVFRSSLDQQNSLSHLNSLFELIQNQLFCVGSLMACEDKKILATLPQIRLQDIENLEVMIDKLDADLPPLKNFVLPGGHITSSHLHVARTICRRSERRCAEVLGKNLSDASESSPTDLCLIYLNRLSDLLFVASRWINLKTNTKEIIWNNK